MSKKVTIDPKQNWINILHGGEELSMSLDSFNKLQQLTMKTIEESQSKRA